MSTGPAIGIDLGTTFSCVGVFHYVKVEIIANDQGGQTMSSCVAFTDKEYLISDAKQIWANMSPTNTVFEAERLIGLRFDDGKVQVYATRWPFKAMNANTSQFKAF